MPSFELQGPDGRLFEVEAPDAASAASAFQQMTSKGTQAPTEDAFSAAAKRTRSGVVAPQRSAFEFSADDAARMAANGLTFGLADKFAGGMDALTGQAPSYDEGVKAQLAQTQKIRDTTPIAAGIAEGAGGLVGGAGLIKSGVTLAGRVGSGLLPRIAGYGAEGAAYGGAHGAGNTYSEDSGDYLRNAGKGAALGGFIGAALPVAGAAAGGTYRAGAAFLGPRVEGSGRGASALLRGAAQADEAGLRSLGQLGPEAMLPDAGPAMLGLAQGAGTGSGPGRSQLIGGLQNRDRTTAQRLAQSLDQNLGPSPLPSRIEAGLSGDRAYIGQEYGPILENAGVADTRQLANELDSAAAGSRGPAQRAVGQVREMLNVPGLRETPTNSALATDAGSLHSTRQAIDGMLTAETNPDVVRRLTLARQEVDAELARAAPGIKQIDAQIEESARQSAGLERGGQVLDSGKTAIRPAELVSEMQQGANPAGQLVGPSAVPFRIRQGVRSDIDRRVGTNINDLTALERTFATPQDWNYQKLGTVFGEGPRDRVAADISANRQFRDTYQKVAQNSQTAQRTEAARSMEGAAGGNVPTDITATSLGLKAVNAIAKVLSGQSNATTRDEVGRLLAKQGPEAQRLAQMLLGSAQTTGSNARSIAALISSPQWIAATAPAAGHR